MGYTVDLQGNDLRCRTRADAEAAAAIVRQHVELCPYHLEVTPRSTSSPPTDDSWSLDIDHFAGDHWHDDAAVSLWLALQPHLADGAAIEFQGEDGWRWRIRWEGGRVLEEHVESVIWAVNRELKRELQPPQKAGAS